MIEIIKKGHKKFRDTCFKCGCEYSYELEDVKKDCVKCPQCGTLNAHMPRVNAIPAEPTPYIGQVTTTTVMPRIRSCHDCDFYKSLTNGQVYVGDSPCYYCHLNPNKVICTQVSSTKGK